MNANPDELRRRIERLREVLTASGIKVTRQRKVVFECVLETNEHPDVETVYRAVRETIPTVSLDTVYRTLWLLRDLGLITTLGPARERVRFDADTSAHHHFICDRCGIALDLHDAGLPELAVPDHIESVGR